MNRIRTLDKYDAFTRFVTAEMIDCLRITENLFMGGEFVTFPDINVRIFVHGQDDAHNRRTQPPVIVIHVNPNLNNDSEIDGTSHWYISLEHLTDYKLQVGQNGIIGVPSSFYQKRILANSPIFCNCGNDSRERCAAFSCKIFECITFNSDELLEFGKKEKLLHSQQSLDHQFVQLKIN